MGQAQGLGGDNFTITLHLSKTDALDGKDLGPYYNTAGDPSEYSAPRKALTVSFGISRIVASYSVLAFT
jgi:hypothetical protein